MVTYDVKKIPNKTGIEVSASILKGGFKYTAASHWYEKEELDDEIKDELQRGLNTVV
jgi:hypothetical protein